MNTPGQLPRILTLMGSGETSPTMVKVHRSVLDRLGPKPIPAVLIDTPYGFQENACELSLRVMNYFDESLRTAITVASGIDPHNPEAYDERFMIERLATNIARAHYVFSGPGSPTYALRKWHDTVVPQLLREKLQYGGAVTFASAAALTLGAFTIPVYEIYKVGDEPKWIPGLDIVSETGLSVAVIPHYNNAEGGTHDTRFCYLGERRLRLLEELLPDDTFVLGVDEHTSCSIDLDAKIATVGGLGVLTVRKNGRSTVFKSGTAIPLGSLVDASLRHVPIVVTTHHDASSTSAEATGESPLLEIVRNAESQFHAAVDSYDAPTATSVILALEQALHEWSSDVPGQDELLRTRASLRSIIAEFGENAGHGLHDPAAPIAPFIDLLISLRSLARSQHRFAEADDIRNDLTELGIELRDTTDETTWGFASGTSPV